MTYKAKIKIMGKVYTSEGDSISEAISNLSPGKAKITGVLTISKGEESKSRILPPNQVFKLFTASPTMRQVAIKNISMMFKL